MTTPASLTLGCLILAAGNSSRLGQPKQLVPWQGQPLLRRVSLSALELAPRDCVVVLGADAGRMRTVIADLAVRIVENPEWPSGMASSLRTGIIALAHCDGILITPCDQYRVETPDLAGLVQRWLAQPERPIASAYAGTRGVPAVLPRRLFPAAQSLRGEAGLKTVLAQDPECQEYSLPSAAIDLDTPEALRELQSEQTR